MTECGVINLDEDEGKRIITFIVVAVIIFSLITSPAEGDGGDDNIPIIVN